MIIFHTVQIQRSLLGTEQHGENSLCTYLECVCAVAKGGVAMQLRCKCQKVKRRKRLVKIQQSLLGMEQQGENSLRIYLECVCSR